MIIRIIKDFYHYLKLIRFQKKYRKVNFHNFTRAINVFSINKVTIGNGTYGAIKVREFENPEERLIIGSYCSIANEVTFLLSGEHSYNEISTYPFKTKILKQEAECICKGKITISDDVWIGYGATILSGVTIGQGAIIGAKSIVAKDVPPYAIFVGNKVVKYRFSEKVITELLKIDFSKLKEGFIKNNIDLMYTQINDENVEEIVKKIKEKN